MTKDEKDGEIYPRVHGECLTGEPLTAAGNEATQKLAQMACWGESHHFRPIGAERCQCGAWSKAEMQARGW